MDAGNRIGPEGAASLVPALEKMPQLTSLVLGGARIRFWARASGAWGVGVFGACCSGTLAGWGCVRRFASGVLRGAAMDADQSDQDDLRCMRRPVLFCQSPAILGRESGWAAPVTLPRCLPCDTGACQWPRERRSAGPHAAVRAAAASDQVRHQPASTVPSISTHLACARAASRMGCCSHPD